MRLKLSLVLLVLVVVTVYVSSAGSTNLVQRYEKQNYILREKAVAQTGPYRGTTFYLLSPKRKYGEKIISVDNYYRKFIFIVEKDGKQTATWKIGQVRYFMDGGTIEFDSAWQEVSTFRFPHKMLQKPTSPSVIVHGKTTLLNSFASVGPLGTPNNGQGWQRFEQQRQRIRRAKAMRPTFQMKAWPVVFKSGFDYRKGEIIDSFADNPLLSPYSKIASKDALDLEQQMLNALKKDASKLGLDGRSLVGSYETMKAGNGWGTDRVVLPVYVEYASIDRIPAWIWYVVWAWDPNLPDPPSRHMDQWMIKAVSVDSDPAQQRLLNVY